ncbi:MAG: hypothetical protein JEZ05_09180 [Tenericutes bacterium]|nr:hypothetical protein [Mycoplasmatota bacterium]
MKKKIILLCVMIFSIVFINTISIMAYSPHYLPGGKNYLSVDNFYYESQDLYSVVDEFLVKPYTDYTLTMPSDLYMVQFTEVEVKLYENNAVVETLFLSPDMFQTEVGDWFYSTFTTSSVTNYMSITFEDHAGYFGTGTAHEIQLEEGSEFSGYEPYIEGVLVDTSAPYFQNAGTVISYFDSPITIAEIQSALSAYDSVDGDVTGSISLISDGYSSHTDTLGIYECVFEVSDNSSNTSQVTVEVELVDVLKPVFSNVATIQAVYPNTYSTNDILAMLSASDNYDGDLSASISLVEDNYTSSSSIVGTYNMEFVVSDSSGNSESYFQMIEVIDDESPIISGIFSVSVGYDEIITEEQILSNLNYTDNYDDNASLAIVLDTDNYTTHCKDIGSYQMTFSVTDSSGNKTSQAVTINVIDEIGPVLYFNSSIVQTYTDTVMGLPDFTQLLINTNEIDGDMNYYVTVRYDSYTRNSTTPGTYHLKLNLKNDFGEEYNKDLEIRVIDRPVDYLHLESQESIVEASFFETFKSYIMGGILSVLLVVSNVVWVVLFKKKS